MLAWGMINIPTNLISHCISFALFKKFTQGEPLMHFQHGNCNTHLPSQRNCNTNRVFHFFSLDIISNFEYIYLSFIANKTKYSFTYHILYPNLKRSLNILLYIYSVKTDFPCISLIFSTPLTYINISCNMSDSRVQTEKIALRTHTGNKKSHS